MSDEKRRYFPRAPRPTIEVTQKEIDEAIPRHSGHCMIADSIRRQIPNAKHISVDLQTIRFSDPKKMLRYTWLTPRFPQKVLAEWDAGIKPEPFSFSLKGARAMVTEFQKKTKRTDKKPGATKLGRGRGVPIGPLGAARLVRRHGPKDRSAVPEVVGGKTPPLVPYGQRREFGVRAFPDNKIPAEPKPASSE